MPGINTFWRGKYIYSIDMMFAYVNIFKPPIIKISLEELAPQLELNVWNEWSPLDVLKDMDKTKYASNVKLIHDADLSYPILVDSKYNILDGFHRFAKALM